jgi:hypothetical protein
METGPTVPFSRLLEFNNAGYSYLKEFPDERSTVTFALQKILKAYKKPLEKTRKKWQDEVDELSEDVRVKYCEKDKETGAFKEKTYGDGPNLVIRKTYSGDNERKANKEIKEINRTLAEKYENEPIELHKVHIVDIPTSMGIGYVEAFADFIFKSLTEEELQAHYLAQKKAELTPSNGVQ